MGQKAAGVYKILKILIILLFTLFYHNTLLAQKVDYEFQLDFIRTVHYPDDLKHSCTPAFTNLLIDVSEKGIIQNLLISDSAPQLFKAEFDRIKRKLNIQLLEKTIAEKRLRNCGIIIPIFYVYGQDYCTNSFADFLSGKYLTFESKTYNKPTFSLEPVMVSFYKPVR